MAYPSIGNSLTSISSLKTSPPSPRLRPRQSEHGPRHPPPPSLVTYTAESKEANPSTHIEFRNHPESGLGLGSVPSPRPRFAHLTSSAPTRPRISRLLSSTSVRMPSPLNPASQKGSSAAKKIEQKGVGRIDLVGFRGSVPDPRPNRLFNSMLGSVPDKTDRAVQDVGDRTGSAAKIELQNEDSKGEACGDAEVNLSRSHAQHAHPVRIAVQPILSPEDPDESWRPRAPNSFSTFVELMFRPRYVLR